MEANDLMDLERSWNDLMATLGVKAIPLCSANAWQVLEQSQTSAFGCSRYLVPTEAAHSLLDHA
ncbi:hypothetical protein AVEN_152429-1, partial [Araneus ventricosus]